MDIFKTDDGMLMVEKRSSSTKEMPKKKKIKLNRNDVFETAMSYSDVKYAGSKSESESCVLCGTKTGYQYRHICENCWSKNESEIKKCIQGMNSELFEFA